MTLEEFSKAILACTNIRLKKWNREYYICRDSAEFRDCHGILYDDPISLSDHDEWELFIEPSDPITKAKEALTLCIRNISVIDPEDTLMHIEKLIRLIVQEEKLK